VNGSELLQKARAAVKAARDFEPAGEHCTAEEVETLNRLCRDAYRACLAAGVSIAEMRLQLWREECEAYRKNLQGLMEGGR
jgi:hypothetical protein